MSNKKHRETQYNESVEYNTNEEELIEETPEVITTDDIIEEIRDDYVADVIEEESFVEELIEETIEETFADNSYYVGIDFENTCNLKNYGDAVKTSNENTRLTGVVHNVYDSTSNILFTSKKKLTLLSHKKRKVNKNADWYA